MKALALISGGLDSLLAARLVKEQGIEVIGLNFKTSFSSCDRYEPEILPTPVSALSANIGIEIIPIDISADFFAILKNPRYGYGSNINPCIDCKILMLRKAKELMTRFDASFIVTGEVLGQRPMSQHRQALKTIEKESGLEGLLLRALSARLLDETIPEREGWVLRSKLLDLNGRSRKPQIALARKFSLKDYPNAAGGCLLTDPEFTKRVKELISYQEFNMDNVKLLRIGRHFRLSSSTKLIVGRNEKENTLLCSLAKAEDMLFMPHELLAGPTCLGKGFFDQDLIKTACSIVCRYCDLDSLPNADIIYRKASEERVYSVNALPIENARLEALRV